MVASAESEKNANAHIKPSRATENPRCGNLGLIARCERADLKSSILCYSYADRYGEPDAGGWA